MTDIQEAPQWKGWDLLTDEQKDRVLIVVDRLIRSITESDIARMKQDPKNAELTSDGIIRMLVRYEAEITIEDMLKGATNGQR